MQYYFSPRLLLLANPRRHKANITLIHPILINPVFKTSPTNPMPTLGNQNLHPLPVLNTSMAEMRRKPKRRTLNHAPLNLGSEFLSLFDACTEECGFCAQFVHCRFVEGVIAFFFF